tara:strand:+ start:1383 stop:1751 length:369 start_codon:yes stop_codon:yes gene_type:complete
MSVTSQLEKAEEAIRQALINALAEGEDAYLTELFEQLNSVRDLKKKVSNTIRFADDTDSYYDRLNDSNYSSSMFDLTSPYITNVKPGKDLDRIDNVLDFPIKIGNYSGDVITFGDTDSPEKT